MQWKPFIIFVFSARFSVNGELKHLPEALELIRPERNTLTVCFADLEQHNQQLATTILQEYYRYSQFHVTIFAESCVNIDKCDSVIPSLVILCR